MRAYQVWTSPAVGGAVAHCHLGLGALYGKTGQPDHARAELDTAIKLYRAMEMTFWLPEAEAAAGAWLQTKAPVER